MTWTIAAYLVGGMLLAALGGAIGLATLARDRWSGGHRTRRCPGCWFDLSATPGLTCPECGRKARAEASLYRTRRRWGRAVTVFLIMSVGGLVVASWPHWRPGQWFDLLPRLIQLEVWNLTRQPEASLRGTLGGIRANWLKGRAMEMGLSRLASRTTPTDEARAASIVLSPNYADWPLTERARAAFLRVVTDPTLGYQLQAVTVAKFRAEPDMALYDTLAGIAKDPASTARANAVETLSILGARQPEARERLVALLRDTDAWGDASTFADALVRSSLLRQDELIEAYLAGSERVRVALAMSASREITGSASGAMTPMLLDAYLFDRYSELYFAAEVALKSAGAKADPVIAGAINDAHGEALTSLLGLIRARPVNSAIVADALDRASDDPSRDAHERRVLWDTSEACRRALESQVSERAWQDALRPR